MLKCPKCGNTEVFMCDVQGTAKYDQTHDSFVEIGDFDFPDDSGCVFCIKCGYNAERSEFEAEEYE